MDGLFKPLIVVPIQIVQGFPLRFPVTRQKQQRLLMALNKSITKRNTKLIDAVFLALQKND